MSYAVYLRDDPLALEVIDLQGIQKYPLREVTAFELAGLRLSKIPGVAYKKDDKLYYAEVPGTLRLSSQDANLGTHLCGKNCTMVCNGCPRTAALTVSFQERIGKKFVEAVKNSWRIEKYPFVTEGIEAFNMDANNDAFVVLQCENYALRLRTNDTPKKSLHDLKLSIANFVWDDFDGGIADMRERIARAKTRES